MKLFITIVQMLSSIFLIVVVLLQEGKSAGISGAISGGAETMFGKNRAKGISEKLNNWTKYVAIAFIVLSIILGMMQ
ncbi:MAG: preprotein translocase subunit SecG [Clostridia bacterium]|nr:preprotein translocase subunit SecG [Clostridia bacterium]